MKKLLILTILSLFGCGRETQCIFEGCPKDDKPEANTVTQEQAGKLKALANIDTKWAPLCSNGSRLYACEEGSDGDSLLWMGLMCLSGDSGECMGVSASQTSDGRFWRSPGRVNKDTSNSFSRDMTLGVIAYLVATKDQVAAQKFYEYVKSHNYQVCDDATDNRCDLGYVQHRSIWGTLKRVWQYIGLNPTTEMIQGDFGDDTIINLESEFSPGGFMLHLVAVEIMIRERMNAASPTVMGAAATIAQRQDQNPFFEYIANGKTERSAALTLQYCPTEKPSPADQWSWQRDQRESAWLNSMGHDCIFMVNLLTGE